MTQPGAKPAKVLVVDDTPANVKLLADLLSVKGYEVFTAANGEDGLKRLAETRPDLVLLDVMMPGMNGYEVCRAIRADKSNGILPVVMVTSLDPTQERIKGLEAGADAAAADGHLVSVRGVGVRLRHAHPHDHRGGHLHLHAPTGEAGDALTPWALFAIFLLGPCEPMIPLLMVPAARETWAATAAVAGIFAAVTIATMLATVWIARRGLRLLPRAALAPWTHAAAGAVISACALALLAWGL